MIRYLQPRRLEQKLPPWFEPTMIGYPVSQQKSKVHKLKKSICLDFQTPISHLLVSHSTCLDSSLVAQMGEDHPRLALIDLRTLITSQAEGSLDKAREYIDLEVEPTDKIIAIHIALEATSPSHPDWLVSAHNNAIGIELRPEVPSHRRLLAQEPNMRLSHWREAISRFKSAECPAAASELLVRLTRSL